MNGEGINIEGALTADIQQQKIETDKKSQSERRKMDKMENKMHISQENESNFSEESEIISSETPKSGKARRAGVVTPAMAYPFGHMDIFKENQLKINAEKYWKMIGMFVKSGKVRELEEKSSHQINSKEGEEDVEFRPMQRRRSQTWNGSELPRRRKMEENKLRPKNSTALSAEGSGAFFLSTGTDDKHCQDGEDEAASDADSEIFEICEIRPRCSSMESRPRRVCKSVVQRPCSGAMKKMLADTDLRKSTTSLPSIEKAGAY